MRVNSLICSQLAIFVSFLDIEVHVLIHLGDEIELVVVITKWTFCVGRFMFILKRIVYQISQPNR